MKIILLVIKVIFLFGHLGYIIAILPGLFPLSISSFLLTVFAIYLVYPSFIILKSFFKENIEQSEKAIKQSLIFTLMFSIAGPVVFFVVLSLPFYSQAFEFFVLPIIVAAGLIASFFLSTILVTYHYLPNQNVANQTSETPVNESKQRIPILAIAVIVVVTFLLLALAIFLSSFRLQGSY